jgi:hypothetical protein
VDKALTDRGQFKSIALCHPSRLERFLTTVRNWKPLSKPLGSYLYDPDDCTERPPSKHAKGSSHVRRQVDKKLKTQDNHALHVLASRDPTRNRNTGDELARSGIVHNEAHGNKSVQSNRDIKDNMDNKGNHFSSVCFKGEPDCGRRLDATLHVEDRLPDMAWTSMTGTPFKRHKRRRDRVRASTERPGGGRSQQGKIYVMHHTALCWLFRLVFATKYVRRCVMVRCGLDLQHYPTVKGQEVAETCALERGY